jgi:hypothetical protein
VVPPVAAFTGLGDRATGGGAPPRVAMLLCFWFSGSRRSEQPGKIGNSDIILTVIFGTNHMAQPSVVLTFNPAGPQYAISEQCVMPSITATATLKDVTLAPGAPPPRFTWNVTLVFTAGSCAHAGSRTTSHSPITATTSLTPPTGNPPVPSATSQFVIPFTEIRGGDLTVSVSVVAGTTTLTASSTGLTVVGTNPNVGSLQSAAPANAAFRKLTRLESGLKQFRSPPCPLFSGDNLGGVGLCQLTSPAPTDDQVWSWKANLAGGIALWSSKESTARGFAAAVRTSAAFTALVAAYNAQRAAAAAAAPRPPGTPAPVTAPIVVTLPDYTSEQLQRETLRGFNGWAAGLHQHRVKVDANGLLVVTLNPAGTQGTAEWEEISAADRIAHYDSIGLAANRRGDPNYVEDVEGQASF